MNRPILTIELLLVALILQTGAVGCEHASGRWGLAPFKGGRLSDRASAARSSESYSKLFVIKLTAEASKPIRQKLRLGDSLTVNSLPVEPLRSVSQKHGIKSWKPVLQAALTDDPTGVNHMYLLTGSLVTKVPETIKDFEALEKLVEYIETGS